MIWLTSISDVVLGSKVRQEGKGSAVDLAPAVHRHLSRVKDKIWMTSVLEMEGCFGGTSAHESPSYTKCSSCCS